MDPTTRLAVPDRARLEVDRLVVRFGGLVAVDHVSLEAPAGRLTGLIGPNGAGKTTTFNACSGLVRATAGSVRLNGRDVTNLSDSARARRGLGRTFQRMELFDSLTVAENVGIGREAGLAGASPWRQLFGRRGERHQMTEAVREVLELCGLQDVAHRRAGVLSTGQRRLIELARVLAGDFQILLLDEPSSGLDRGESDSFGQILTHVVSERGLGVLLVEHDMELVMAICDHVYVIDFGKPLFEGPPAAVQRDGAVRAAYLGEES